MTRLSLILLLVPSTVFAFNVYNYQFSGRWQPSEEPILMDDGGFSDIQNMRKREGHLVGISGHTSISTDSNQLSTYPKVKAMKFFSKDFPRQTNAIVYAEKADGSAFTVTSMNEEPPGQDSYGNTLQSGAVITGVKGRFSDAPQGNIIFTTGSETFYWGGQYDRIGAMVFDSNTLDNEEYPGIDYDTTAKVTNTDGTLQNVVIVDDADDTKDSFYLGARRPVNGFYFDLSKFSKTDMDPAVTFWDGDSWEPVKNLQDNTNGFTRDGGEEFGQNGRIIFNWLNQDIDLAKPKYLFGYILYWYYFSFSPGSAEIKTIYTYTTTVSQASMRNLNNIWSGELGPTAAMKVYYTGAGYYDYSDEISVDDDSYVAYLDNLRQFNPFVDSDCWYVGFTTPQQGIRVKMADGKGNSNNSVLWVYYWNGSKFDLATGWTDGTNDGGWAGGITLNRDGYITWPASSTVGEQKTTIDGVGPLFWYKFVVTSQLDAEVEINYIAGIEAQQPIPGYSFATMFQNRVILFDEYHGARNSGQYSAYNTPDVFNGSDSGYLYFGDDSPVTAATAIYNIFRTTGLEQLIVTKANETWRIYGDGPSNWVIQQMSQKIGCPAPLSMVACELLKTDNEPGKHVIIYQAADGVVVNDGGSIKYISDDISVYWDPNDDRAIPDDRIDDSYGWYDPNLNAYKLLISSGAGQETHNVELEYSLKYNEWTKIYRTDTDGASPLQAGATVFDLDGNSYSYAVDDTAFMFRLENGTEFEKDGDRTDIEQYVETKNLLLDPELPFLYDATIKYMRLGFEDKDEAVEEDISVIHYCNDSQSVTGADYQTAPSPIDMTAGPHDTQRVELGPCTMHRFKFSATTDDAVDGMELVNLGLYFDPKSTISGVTQ